MISSSLISSQALIALACIVPAAAFTGVGAVGLVRRSPLLVHAQWVNLVVVVSLLLSVITFASEPCMRLNLVRGLVLLVLALLFCSWTYLLSSCLIFGHEEAHLRAALQECLRGCGLLDRELAPFQGGVLRQPLANGLRLIIWCRPGDSYALLRLRPLGRRAEFERIGAMLSSKLDDSQGRRSSFLALVGLGLFFSSLAGAAMVL
jgi:hypothetical protein